MAYFDASKMPSPNNEYVCFLDIMGIQNKMLASLPQSSNFMFKLHATLLEVMRERSYKKVSIYPIMDGAYLASSRKDHMQNILTSLFQKLSVALRDEQSFAYWYFVRASLAYGPIIHGRDIPYIASDEFTMRIGYKEQIFVGSPIIWACSNEKLASPMGVNIHDSADINGTTKPHGYFAHDWKWWDNNDIKVDRSIIIAFKERVKEYYRWLKSDSVTQSYPIKKQNEHEASFEKYFAGI